MKDIKKVTLIGLGAMGLGIAYMAIQKQPFEEPGDDLPTLLMDAMIDAHKHSFQVRPVLFGDPELVFALAGFCAENGMFPGVVATGGGSAGWRKAVTELLVDSLNPLDVIEETDMSIVRTRSEANQVNLAVGPSVGRYLEEQADIPLVRIGFPIQDRASSRYCFG